MGRTDKKVRIFSALEVANICGVVNQTAINWIKHGYLEAFTTPGGQYRVYSEDLVGFLQSRGMRVPEELQSLTGLEDKTIKVIIVDDDEELNGLIRDYVQRHRSGYTVFQAFDGFDAGHLVAESKPDIVVLDVDLPGVDGRTLCHRIKNTSDESTPAIIAISGYEEAMLREDMLAHGADAFVGKPFELSDLLSKMDEFLSR